MGKGAQLILLLALPIAALRMTISTWPRCAPPPRPSAARSCDEETTNSSPRCEAPTRKPPRAA